MKAIGLMAVTLLCGWCYVHYSTIPPDVVIRELNTLSNQMQVLTDQQLVQAKQLNDLSSATEKEKP